MTPHPHGDQPILHRGVDPKDAEAVVILVHGRGGNARDMLTLADELGEGGVAWLAPQAASSTWYPLGFMAPTEANEPMLSSALKRLHGLLDGLEEQGVAPENMVLLGFSQGACLTLEAAARRPRPYGGVLAFSGGLIGPEIGEHSGDFAGAPLFLGCSDRDAHIPLERVRESSAALENLGAEVDERIYPGMPHTINQDELEAARRLIAAARATEIR